jgi:hypothetical protein
MAVSLLGLGLFLTGSALMAQSPVSPPGQIRSEPAIPAASVLRFTNDPDAASPGSLPAGVLRFTKETAGQPVELGPVPALVPTRGQPKPAAPPAYGVQTTAMQFKDKMPDKLGAPEENQEYFVQLEPPGPQRLFRLESERSLQERMRQEALALASPARLEFPHYKPLTEDQPPPTRTWPCRTMAVEPAFVCFGRLYFQQINAERYGWDLGVVAPFVAMGQFYKDVALLPYRLATDPCRRYECNAGYCLPGDPVPLLCYPLHASLTGAAAQAGAILALVAIFP